MGHLQKYSSTELLDALNKHYFEGTINISQADFSAKISIAYKECLETKYWLSLLKDTGYIEQKAFDSIYKDADEIGKILFSILKTTKINPQPTSN
ncbi:four helix bundle protein [Nostoc sp.]|uniref:four helix bundle protein n=1 Tax=Nostoc sp. TaxID=1180 RepID=UPI002FF6EBE8